jgi:glyoxylate/hydroxypyruvate reductase A
VSPARRLISEDDVPMRDALASLPTVVLTPHVAAGTELITDVRAILDNIARTRRGEPVAGLVDRATA